MAKSMAQDQGQEHKTTAGLLGRYDPGAFFCELTTARESGGREARLIAERLSALGVTELRRRAEQVERSLYDLGVTFTVYSDASAIDRILPFDLIPRVLFPAEWAQIEAGVAQRVRALNLFLHDVYHDQHILKDGTIPAELVLKNSNYRPEMVGVDLKHGTYIQICGIDLVRDERGAFFVLEDNGRTPSGASYVIENRHAMARVFPDLMADIGVRPIDNYGLKLQAAMSALAPESVLDPHVVLLSPGIYNSAYFEHVCLAREMGCWLVEGRDLVAIDDRIYMRTTGGLVPVHVIYRRINDDFLDPQVFRPDSMLGVPGVMAAFRKGNVALANAIGTGVADDKAVYAYLPKIIRYYLDQDAILPNVETNICREPAALQYTLDNLAKLVVKPVGESGGYGMLVGPAASAAEIAAFRDRLLRDPANYISQPTLKLSVAPTLTDGGIAPRHVDLRPFAITGDDTWVLPGGLTRVALKQGSLVVNSSQGGGSKDTWVLS